MSDIVLATLNARYAHSAFGLRYLLANLGDLRGGAEILEFDLQQRPTDVVERILAGQPRIVGLGVYIWNVEPLTRVVATLKRLRPEITVVLGGPEVSHGSHGRPIVRDADFVIEGEADLAFASLCRGILDGEVGASKFVQAGLPALDRLVLPLTLDDGAQGPTVAAGWGCTAPGLPSVSVHASNRFSEPLSCQRPSIPNPQEL